MSLGKCLSNAKIVAVEVDIEIEFPITTLPVSEKYFFNYEAVKEPVSDPEINFKIHFYYYLPDTRTRKVDNELNF